MKNTPKYSIIVPTYNGIQYLPTCIETIISQDYKDYELIISDDHSSDGTREYLESLNHPNIAVIYPPESLSMTEHWEWALSHSTGEWQIFVGQDDGLQAYFFQLADRLTKEASRKNLRTIMSSRAYFFWKGCKYVYGDTAVSYVAENKIKVHNFKYEVFKSLLGIQTYFVLPQMYTTALFHKTLLEEARSKQNGKVLSCHPQDANLAAIAYRLEKEYLKSYIPLGWVGTSPKSAGMAISGDNEEANDIHKEDLKILKEKYINKIEKSKFKYHELAGPFSFGNNALYFWQALLMTSNLRTERNKELIISPWFKLIFFGSILHEVKYLKVNESKRDQRLILFREILIKNKCNFALIALVSFVKRITSIIVFLPTVVFKVFRKGFRLFSKNRISGNVKWESSEVSMLKVSNIYKDILDSKKWV